MARTADLEALLARGPDSALLRFALASAHLGDGAVEEALRHLQVAVALDPDYSAAWKLLGKVSAEAGKLEAAANAYERGIDAATRRGDIQAAKEMRVFLKRLRRE